MFVTKKFCYKIKACPTPCVGVCTTFPCAIGCPKPSPRECYRSKSEGMCTIEYYHVGHQAVPRNERARFCYKNHTPNLA